MFFKQSFVSLICQSIRAQKGGARRPCPAPQPLTCVEPVAFPRAVAAGAPRPLLGRGFGHRHHHQALDGRLGVVGPQLHKATVDHKRDALHCDGGLGDVGGHDDLRGQARRGSCELPALRDPIRFLQQGTSTQIAPT